MEQSCYKCGASVQEGTAFCKQCGAPQIRVMIAGAEAPVTAPDPESGETPGPLRPLRLPVIASGRVEWSQALPAAALGGVCSLIALQSPVLIFIPALAASGIIAVTFYYRHKNQTPNGRAGALVGAASGAFGAILFGLMAAIKLAYHPDELRQQVLDTIAQLTTRGFDPTNAQRLTEIVKTPEGLASWVIAMVMVAFFIAVTGSSIAGALCASLLRKRMQG